MFEFAFSLFVLLNFIANSKILEKGKGNFVAVV